MSIEHAGLSRVGRNSLIVFLLLLFAAGILLKNLLTL